MMNWFDSVISSVTLSNENQLPDRIQLYQNYPNPFNSETMIHYELPSPARVSLKVYNLVGQEIKTLIDESQSAGDQKAIWNGRDNAGNQMPSGIYFVKLNTTYFSQTQKMILLQ
jgi:hypothetical protein